jgi:hypothetical protein
MPATCAHASTVILHQTGEIRETREHVFTGMKCWCAPRTACVASACRALDVPLQGVCAHVFPMWIAAVDVEDDESASTTVH